MGTTKANDSRVYGIGIPLSIFRAPVPIWPGLLDFSREGRPCESPEGLGVLEEFAKIVRFRVPFSDIDMMRHANNTAYARWAELARSEYLIEVIETEIGGSTGMILARLDITYEKQISYRENIAIGCRISRLGNKSFDFLCEVWSEDREVRCANIAQTMVAMDYENNVTIAVPALWRERIAAFEPAKVPA